MYEYLIGLEYDEVIAECEAHGLEYDAEPETEEVDALVVVGGTYWGYDGYELEFEDGVVVAIIDREEEAEF